MKHGKRDNAHTDIVHALRSAGCSVVDLGDVGNGCPDLLVGCRGLERLMEVKSPGETLNWQQSQFHASWRGRGIAIVRDVKEALTAVGL